MSAPLEMHDNAGALARAFVGLAGDLENLTGPLGAVGHIALEAARAGAPYRSGAMRAAHSVSPARGNRVRVTVETPYANAVHWGWPRHGIRRQPWIVATFNREQSTWQATAIDRLQDDIDRAAGQTGGPTK